MMGKFHLHVVVFLATSLAVLAGANPVLPRSSNEISDSPDVNEVPIGNSLKSSAVRIDVSIEPPWKANWVVSSREREIDVLSGEKIVEKTTPKNLYAKYFESAPMQNVTFQGEGIAKLNHTKKSGSSLEIGPLKPGTYKFGYSIRRDDEIRQRTWTVHSVSSREIQRDSLFEFKLDFFESPIAKDVTISGLPNMGVDVEIKSGLLVINGLANDIRNGSILAIRLRDSDSTLKTRKVRLLLAEPKNTEKLCVNKNIPCVENIQLWFRNSESTIQNRMSLAKCVRAAMKSPDSGLFGVRFENYGTDATFFSARPSDVYVCSYLDFLSSRIIKECQPHEVVGYRLTCSTEMKDGEIIDKKMVEFKPPAPRILQTTTEVDPQMKTIDAGKNDQVSTVSETPSIPTTTEQPQPFDISTTPRETLTEAPGTESPEQVRTTSSTESATSRPSSTEGPEPMDSSSPTSETTVEPSTTEGPEPMDSSSTTSETPLEPSTTEGPEPMDSSSSPAPTSSEPSSTVGSAPVEDEPASPKAFQESSTTIGSITTEVSTTGSGGERSTTPSMPTTTPSKDLSVATEPVTSGDLGTSKVGPAMKGSVAPYTSVADHLYSYAIYLAVVFVILFILIACLSR